MQEQLILVDKQDNEIGAGEKLFIHERGMLHRAFSVFILDQAIQRVLIQKRAIGKYHSGGLWTNACCSHPRKGEELLEAVFRRVKEELGVSIPDTVYEGKELCEIDKFTYRKDFGKYIEYEIDHVFVWSVDSSTLQLSPNKEEVESYLWIDLDRLMSWMEQSPEDFTAWFFNAFEVFANNSTILRGQISTALYGIIQRKKSEVQFL